MSNTNSDPIIDTMFNGLTSRLDVSKTFEAHEMEGLAWALVMRVRELETRVHTGLGFAGEALDPKVIEGIKFALGVLRQPLK